MSYCAIRRRPRGLGDTQNIAAGAATGAAAGAPGGPVGLIIGAGAGALAAKSTSSSGGGASHQGGPGSFTYWKGQLQRLQAIMQNPANPRSVQQAAKALAARYKASDKGDAIKGAYPAIPEDQIAALEGSAAAGKSPFGGSSGSMTTWLIVGGVALALVVGGVIYATRRKKKRR